MAPLQAAERAALEGFLSSKRGSAAHPRRPDSMCMPASLHETPGVAVEANPGCVECSHARLNVVLWTAPCDTGPGRAVWVECCCVCVSRWVVPAASRPVHLAGETRGARWSSSLCDSKGGEATGDIRGIRRQSSRMGCGGGAETSDPSPPSGASGTPWLLSIWMELSLSQARRPRPVVVYVSDN